MSALPKPAALRRVAMGMSRLDEVVAVEQSAYAFPWTRGNFIDSLAAGYLAELLLDELDTLVGYFVAMPGYEEMHLLNLTVRPSLQGRGHARTMLDALVVHSRHRQARSLWLEVREGNARARALYERYGFVTAGLRRGYYPAAHGQREDAVVMSFALDEGERDDLD